MKFFQHIAATALLIGANATAGGFVVAGGDTNSVTEADAVNINAKLAYPIMLKSAEENYLKISLNGATLEHTHPRSPINVSLVIDRSGSMGGQKIQQARAAAMLAVDMLSEQDMISIIGYDTQAEVIVHATKLTDKDEVKKEINRAIKPAGNTALFAGVSKGIKETQKFFDRNNVNRVILLSDGQANVGPSSTSELGELGKTASKKGITVSTIGLGLGYNEDLMTALAGYSDGNHIFVERADSLSSVFQREFDDVMNVVAQNVKIDIDIKNGKPLRLLGREGDIRGNHVTVNLKQIYAKQEKYVLLAIAPNKGERQGEKTIAEVAIRYDSTKKKAPINTTHQVKILYSDSQETVNKAINEDVLADYYIQKSNFANELAIISLDAGNNIEANQILKEAAEQVQNQMPAFTSSSARQKIFLQTSNLNTAADKAIAAPKREARKSIKASSYKVKNQQK